MLLVVAKAEIDDADEVLRAEWAYCGLRIGKAAFDKLAVDCSRDIVSEVEIGVGFDEREIMALARGIGNDPLDPCDGIKAPAASLDGLIIDSPIAFKLIGARQIGFGELILPIGLVGIVRIAAMDEDPGH